MISLRKHIEAYTEELAKTAVCSYKELLNSIASAAVRANPRLGGDLGKKLTLIREKLSGTITPGQLAELQQSADQELSKWGDTASQYSGDIASEIKDVMIAVAATASAVAERDERYSGQFNGLATKLQSVAKLEDLSGMRRSVLESTTQLTAAVRKMNEENRQSVSQLRAEVANYRAKLQQSEQRGATDPLTGLANRREVEAQIEERVSWKSMFCLAFLDLDGFKQVNDTYGHQAGDDLLKQFASELRGQVRQTDVVGRWAGDEFVVIVDTGLKEAQGRLDRIRDWALGDYTISDGKDSIQIRMNASIGVAEWNKEETAAELLARADKCMYAAKRWSRIPRGGVA